MKTKVSVEIIEGYQNRLKNKLYSLLCAREENGEWLSFLDNIIIELEGIPVEDRSINYLVIYYKINSLRYVDYKWFRKIIFDCMSLLSYKDGEVDGVL